MPVCLRQSAARMPRSSQRWMQRNGGERRLWSPQGMPAGVRPIRMPNWRLWSDALSRKRSVKLRRQDMEFPFPKFTKRQQKASQKAKVPTPSKRGGVYAPEERTVQTTVKLDKLPKVLRSSIIEKNLQIFEIPSPSSN